MSTSYTVSELARREKIGRTKLYELIAEGKLPAKKRGRNTIILAKDYEAVLADLPDALASGAIRPAKPEKRAA